MVATAKRKAERAAAQAKAQAKAQKQAAKNASKATATSTPTIDPTSALPPTTDDDSNGSIPIEKGTGDDKTGIEIKPDVEQKDKKHRFIVFIGNLPYTATTEQIKQHFASVSPSSVRHSTDKSTGKSKGFAFLEFDDYTRMETCIRTFHHSLFGAGENDAEAGGDAGPKRKSERVREQDKLGRRINVELTVGGGGSKSSARRSKIIAKNEKLGEERRKRAAVAVGKDGTASAGKKAGIATGEDEESHIHPSRRAKVSH